MPRGALPPLIVLLALLAAPAPVAALSFDLGLRGGVASPRGEAVSAGPSLGVGASLALGSRYRVVLGLDQSRHGFGGAGVIDATTGWLGVEVALDELPIVPSLSLGPALQFAARRDRDASARVPAGFAALGLRALVWRGLVLGAQVRYLSSDFSAEGFPAFSSFVIELGWAL